MHPKHNSASPKKSSKGTWDHLIQEEPDNGLSLERVVSAAIAIADKEGLPAISFRRIAARLGRSPMGLYHYVPSKRDLLNLMLDAVSAEFQIPTRQLSDWKGLFRHYAREIRTQMQRHPWVANLRADNPEYGPASIRIVDFLFKALSDFGLDTRASLKALPVLYAFTIGFVASEPNTNSSSPSQTQFSHAVLATGKYPNAVKYLDLGAKVSRDEVFEQGVDWVLNGIEAEIDARRVIQRAKRKK